MVINLLGASPFAALTAFTIGITKPIMPTNKNPNSPKPNSNIPGTLITMYNSKLN